MKAARSDHSNFGDLKARLLASLLLFLLLLPVASNAQHLRIYACAISNNSAGAFLGGSSRGSGLYQSDDTGKTWKHLGWDNIKCYSMDMVQSSNGRILYEATGLGVLRSTDYGEHWKQITDWRISEVMDVAVNQAQPGVLYIATAHGAWRLLEREYTLHGSKDDPLVDEAPVRLDTESPYCSKVLYRRVDNNDHFLFKCGNRFYETTSFLDEWTTNYSTDDVKRAIQWDGHFLLDEMKKVLQEELVKTNLSHRQIWTLKSFLVTP